MSFKKHIKGLDALEKKIGYSFRDKSILTKSLTHPSFDNNKFSNMERLEFLGDRVLGLVISEAIFLKFNSFNEGSLSRYHNYFVQRSTCVLVAKKINLNDFIIFGKSEFSKDGLKDSILSNILEALIGAVFVDSSYETTQKIGKISLREIGRPINSAALRYALPEYIGRPICVAQLANEILVDLFFYPPSGNN